MFKNFSKKDISFFELFQKNAELSYTAALKLNEFAHDLTNPSKKYHEIKEIENQGDNQIHAIFTQLNKAFITPLDREDIHHIAKGMDDVTDFIESAASRFLMFNITEVPAGVTEMTDLIVKCSKEVTALMYTLNSSESSAEVQELLTSIGNFEAIGDALFRQNITKLFHNGTSDIEIVKLKDIYESLEAVINACEDVANIIQGILMKHA